MNIEFKLLMPPMPDYIAYDQPSTGLRQDGFTFNKGVPIGQLSQQQAEQYAEEMKQCFLEHWKQKSINM